MRIPLTKYGLPQVVIYPFIVLVLMIVLFVAFGPVPWLIPVEILLFLVFLWMFSFFMAPVRNISYDEMILLSPADGTITDIDVVDDSEL